MVEVRMRTILLLLSLTLVAGCQYVPPRDIGSPFFSPPAGSQLRLTRPLTIPANDAGVFIQYGKPQYSVWQPDRYYPSCDFELRTRSSHERVVEPDTFTVTRTVRETENVMLAPAIVASHDTGNGAPHENYMTILYLHSDKQPDVFRMTCQHWEDPSDAQHLTIKQIRQALGDLFTLTLPEKAG
jgi:hypothetical protein